MLFYEGFMMCFLMKNTFIYTKKIFTSAKQEEEGYIQGNLYPLSQATKVEIKSQYATASKDLTSLISKKYLANNCIHTSSLHMVQKADKELTSL